MNGRDERLERLYEEALALPEEERDALVGRACADEPRLGAELASLLVEGGGADTFMQDVGRLVEPASDAPPERLVKALAGRSRIVREIGQGGMSTVYLAERADGQFERRVAIKVVREGLPVEDLGRRVQTERQVLASLDHPEIARLLDANLTEDGRPYLVMEHVEGLPLDVHMDRHRLTVAERLRLFCCVAHALVFVSGGRSGHALAGRSRE